MNDPELVAIRGGLAAGKATHATVGDLKLSRLPGETLVEFEARAVAVASIGRHQFVVLGGLPEDNETSANFVRQADDLANRLLAAAVPAAHEHYALRGLANLAEGLGLPLTDRHREALLRLPPAADMARWEARYDRMTGLREQP